jgi:hypothetical protein
MDLSQATLAAFKDELEKIAGGFARTGIRPYKADTLLKQTGRFVKKQFMGTPSSLMKTSASTKAILTAGATGAALGIYGQHKAKKMHEDYQMGRQVRRAQQGG